MRRSTLSGNPLARIPAREHRITGSVVVLLDFVPSLAKKLAKISPQNQLTLQLSRFPNKSCSFRWNGASPAPVFSARELSLMCFLHWNLGR